MTGTSKSITLSDLSPGVNNRRPDFRLEKVEGGKKTVFVRAAVNADITAEGTAKRRKGYELLLAGDDCHSFWADADDAFYADGQSLKRLTIHPDAATAVTLRSDLVPGRPLSYARTPDGVYYSNGVTIGRIDNDGALQPLAPPLLAVTPAVTAAAGGSLPAGRYSVCFTYRDADGREGGSTTPEQIEVAANGVVHCANLPAAFPSGVTDLVIYLSATNDATPLRAAVLTTAATTHDITGLPALGGRCQTLLLMPMPAGDIVRFHNGRLLVASGRYLYISEPYALGLFNPTRGYYPFTAELNLVEPLGTGVWVGADQTWWLAGDIAAAPLGAPVLPYGAIARTASRLPDATSVTWMTSRGAVLGDATGQASNLQEANVAINPAAMGASLQRERDGMKQMVSSLFGAETTRVAASSYMTAETYRKGTTL